MNLKDLYWDQTFSKYILLQSQTLLARMIFKSILWTQMSTLLYLPFDLNNPSDEIAARCRIELCIKDIKLWWMTVNKLKLKDDKTELTIITSKYHIYKPTTDSLQIASSNIHSSASARNLGITLTIHFPWRITSRSPVPANVHFSHKEYSPNSQSAGWWHCC